MITDESGEVVKEKKYEAFGNLVWEEGDLEDNREFTGKEKDPTGFHYFGARYYSGDIGRFLSPDPHTMMPGNIDLSNPQELNPYVYCYNDPLNLYDPDGRSPFGVVVEYVYATYQSQIPTVGGCHCWAGASAEYFSPDNLFGYSFSRACQLHDMAYATEGISKGLGDVVFKKALFESVLDQSGKQGLDFDLGIQAADFYYNAVVDGIGDVGLGGCAMNYSKLAAKGAYISGQADLKYKWTKGKLINEGEDILGLEYDKMMGNDYQIWESM
jgi:RHS repeat-associated protein